MSVTVLWSVRYLALVTPLVASALAGCGDGEKGFLYSLNAGTGKVGMFRIQMDGTLAAMGEIAGPPASAGAQGLAAY